MTKITILGSGSWGCALAYVLGYKGYSVCIWGRNEDQIQQINQHHSQHFMDIDLPETILGTTSLEDAADYSDDIVIALPSHAIMETLERFNACLNRPVHFINASKGLEPYSLMRISEVVYETIHIDHISSYTLLTGPSHAEEVIRRGVTSITSISYNEAQAERVQHLFSTDFLRVYTNNDIVGGELCGAMKNAMAIGAGILDGMGFGDNAKAAFIVRSIHEMMRLGERMGISSATFTGLAGMGDAIVTCISRHSRNRNAGELIGKGMTVQQALDEVKMVVEGIGSIKSIYRLSKQYNVTMPIIHELYQVVYSSKGVRDSIESLMSRDLRAEGW